MVVTLWLLFYATSYTTLSLEIIYDVAIPTIKGANGLLSFGSPKSSSTIVVMATMLYQGSGLVPIVFSYGEY